MSILDIWLLGIALAMDCFAASIATGASVRRFVPAPMLCMAALFGLFQGGMTLLGYAGMIHFRESIEAYDHWIAFILLAYLGLRMIYHSFRQGESNEEESRPGLLSLSSQLIMAIATSIDALAVGISFACMEEVNTALLCRYAAIIGFCSLALSLIGLGIGIRLARRTDWHFEALGGIILLLIGIKILVEHIEL